MHYSGNSSQFSFVIFVEGKDTINFKADKNVNFPAQYCLGSLSNGFDATESREVSLKGNIYVFSVNYISIDKCDISNIHKYLIAKNDSK